jgi:glycerol-3-phosphate O-acyltransferase
VRDLTRDLVESYRVFVGALSRVQGPLDKKALLALGLEHGRAEFLAGTIACAEALSRPAFENALALCIDQGVLVEHDKKFELAESYRDQARLAALLAPIDRLLAL